PSHPPPRPPPFPYTTLFRSNAPADRAALWREDAPFVIDIRDDGAGEYFKLTHRPDVVVDVQDVQLHDRHLLLTAHIPDRAGAVGDRKSTRLNSSHSQISYAV